MEFSYIKCEGEHNSVFRPYLPVTLCYKSREFPIGNALVDTGADFTILPREIAHILEVELDDSKAVRVGAAGGGIFTALPSQKPLIMKIEKRGFQPVTIKGIVYFAEKQSPLLGHRGCLEYLDLYFNGPEKTFSITPR